MKFRVRSQETFICENSHNYENDMQILLDLGFKLSREEDRQGRFRKYKNWRVYTDEIEGMKVMNPVEIEFNSFEDFLALADKYNTQLIYSNGTWELFNDIYAFS